MGSFCKDDFYFKGCTLALSYITLTTVLLQLLLLVCCALNILQHSWLHLAAVMFAFFSCNLQYVPLASCVVCPDAFSCPATCTDLDFLVHQPVQKFLLPICSELAVFSVFNFVFAIKLLYLESLYLI